MPSKMRPGPPARLPDRQPHRAGRDPARQRQPAGRIAGLVGGACGCQRLVYLAGACLVVVGPAHAASGRWRVGRHLNAPAARDAAFQDQLQRPRRAALATGVLDAPAVARVAVEDLPVSPDRHAALVPLSPAQPPQRPSHHPSQKGLSLPSR